MLFQSTAISETKARKCNHDLFNIHKNTYKLDPLIPDGISLGIEK